MREIVLDTKCAGRGFPLQARRLLASASIHRLVQPIGGGDWRLNIPVALALEYEDVLKRKDVAGGIREPDVDLFLDYVFRAANLVPFVPSLAAGFARSGRRAYSGSSRFRYGHQPSF